MLSRPVRLLLALILAVSLARLSHAADAIHFELPAYTAHNAYSNRKCIGQYVMANMLVLLNVNVGIGYNQRVDLEISDNSPEVNRYDSRKNVDEAKIGFRTLKDADVTICFTNTLNDGFLDDGKFSRTVELDFDIGADAEDYAAMAEAEKLKPMELELKKLEKVVEEIMAEIEYLKNREVKMRDTNESTNERVQWFSLLSMATLISLGAFQIWYLRKFFKRKRLID
jgi:hypothetical protein